MTSIQGQNKQEENSFFFGFWLMAGENTDFTTQYLAKNRILGDGSVNFLCKVYLHVNKWRKSSFGIFFNHVYGSLRPILMSRAVNNKGMESNKISIISNFVLMSTCIKTNMHKVTQQWCYRYWGHDVWSDNALNDGFSYTCTKSVQSTTTTTHKACFHR